MHPVGENVELSSDHLRVVVDVARGGQIVHIGRPGGANVLFHEDWPTPLPASGVAGYGSDALDWLSHYRGGWQVMFPNAGAGCVMDGVPLPLHGEVSTAPQRVIAQDATSLVIESATRRPLRLHRRLHLDADQPVLRIEETAHNDADGPLPVAHGQHPAFRATPGMRIDLPEGVVRVDHDLSVEEADLEPGAVGVWPHVAGLGGSSADLSRIPADPVERVCYLPDRPAGWAALRDPASGVGVAMAWDPEAFPHLWLWEQIGGRRFPFFGRARIVALEPVSIWPADGLEAAAGRGQARNLDPGPSTTAWTTLSLFDATELPVSAVDRDGTVHTASSA